MRKMNISLFLGAVLGLLLSTPARAELIYSVGISAPTTVSPGLNFNATVYLQEVVTGASTTVLGDPGLGIVQGNFLVNRTAGSSIDITGVTLNPAFDNPGSTSFAANFASGTQFSIGLLSGTETFAGSGVFRLNLGTISMTATAFGDTTFTSADFDAGLDDLVLGDGTILDSTIAGGGGFGDITITSAPEPTTMGALGAFGAIGAAVSYFRRRKEKTKAPVAE